MRSHHDDGLLPEISESISLFSSMGNDWSGGPFIKSAHDLHELASQQNERAPQYEEDAIEKEMLAGTGWLKHPHLHDGVYVRREISNDQAAYYQVVHLVTP
jgi:hypothetical protein